MVGLNRHEVIGSLLKEDLLTGFHLGVGGVAEDDFAGQVQTAEQLASRGDFVALGLRDEPA